MGAGNGIEEIPRIYEENGFPLPAKLFDKGGAPGQTAKQIILSPARFYFSLHIGGEEGRHIRLGLRRRGLRASLQGER